MEEINEIINLGDFRGRDTIEVCKSIIERVRSGKCTGMIFVLREADDTHIAGATGEYKKNPGEICQVAGDMLSHYSPYHVKYK